MAPKLIVTIPRARQVEREYVLSVLLKEWLGVEYTVQVDEGAGETAIRIMDGHELGSILIPDVLLADDSDWLGPKSLPGTPLPIVSAPEWLGREDPLPLLFASDPTEPWLVRSTSSRHRLGFDLIGAIFFLLARYEEYVEGEDRDGHERFPSQASVLQPGGWLRWPVADMYVRTLSTLLDFMVPGMVPSQTTGEVVISHDVDHPAARYRWPGVDGIRVVAADAWRRRDLSLALRRAAGLTRLAGLARRDPYDTFEFLMDMSESAGLRSTFFFLTIDSALPFGSAYSLDDRWARDVFLAIAERGHRIGLHGSYVSSTDAARLGREWDVLERSTSNLPTGVVRRAVRQHYLMMKPGHTWRAQSEAGLEMDETLGFADDIGYRAGTARTFPAFDLEARAVLPLRVRPLHIMDVTFTDYLGMGADEAWRVVESMSTRTRFYGGDLSLLWHNSSLETAHRQDAYRALVKMVTS